MKVCSSLLFFIWMSLSEAAIIREPSPLPTMYGDCLFYNPSNVSYVFDTAEIDTLVSAQVIFRHSARSPTKFFPTDAFAKQSATLWPNGLGKLTDDGKCLASQLGTYIRTRYDTFLAKNYTEKEVFVQCSDVPRAIETVTRMLRTLFNCDSIIKINIIDQQNDNKIQMRAHCNSKLALHAEYKKSKEVQDFYTKTKANNLFTELTKLTGKKIKTLDDVGIFGDTIWSECQRGLSSQFPAWVNKYYPGQTQAFRDLDFNSYTATPKLARLVVGSLFSEMIQSFKVAIGSANSWGPMLQKDIEIKKAKLYVYSGHEATIYAFLNALKLFDNQQVIPQAPLYTSAIFFELHCPNNRKCKSQPENEDNYVVKVFYKQRKDAKAQHLILEACAKSSDGCTLKNFQLSYYYLLFKNTAQTHEWVEECDKVMPAEFYLGTNSESES